jgi:hypothetical protein
MIIDKILDKRDGDKVKLSDIYNQAMIWEMDYVSRALDSGDENDIKKALCDYIDNNNYNPSIKDFIMKATWLEEDNE